MDFKEIPLHNIVHDDKFCINNGLNYQTQEKGETYSIDDAVNKAGFGKFQIRLLCLAGLGWLADAAEIFILSVIGGFLSCEWELKRWQIAMLTSLVFAGIMIGCPLFGLFADKYGRKKSLSVSLSLLFVFGAVSAAMPSYEWLVALRMLTGFALGGISQGLTLCSEYCPANVRGRAGFVLCYFWALGTLLVVLISWLVTVYLNNWRILLAIAAVPALLVVVSLKWYPESSRYYLVSNNLDKATKMLQKMADMNGSSLPVGRLTEIGDAEVRGRFQDLLNVEYRKITLLYWYIWFSAAFGYYGICLLAPIIIENGGFILGGSNGSDHTDLTNMSQVIPCNQLSQQNFIDLLWTSSAEFPGLIAYTFLVDYCTRRMLVGGTCIISSVLILLLLLPTSKTVILLFLFGARGILASFLQLIFIITIEAFPTTVRALAMGTGSAFSRLGGLLVPYVAQVMITKNPVGAICLLAGVIFISAIIAMFIPETKGAKLKENMGRIK